MNSNFSHHATVIPVSDMTISIDFYTVELGFKITYSYGYPLCYAVLREGGTSIHLALQDEKVNPNDNLTCYIFCNDVNQFYNSLNADKMKVISNLNTADYNMTEFQIEDPDGHKIAFGQES